MNRTDEKNRVAIAVNRKGLEIGDTLGMLFDEITASSLVKVDQQCNKVIDSPYPVNPAGFVIHSAVHAAREDVQCVLHTHTRAGIAVSAQKNGVLPISQQSTFVLACLSPSTIGVGQ